MSTLNINDNNFLRQFEVNINGQLAKVEYALQERKIFLDHIRFVNMSFDGIVDTSSSIKPFSKMVSIFFLFFK